MNFRKGSILVALLWCLSLLSVVVVGVLYTSRVDLMVGKNFGDVLQAQAIALAGIEKTKALLFENASERRRASQSHDGKLFNAPAAFRNIEFASGRFSVFRQASSDESGGILYGVSDEESRLNINTATSEQLSKLPGMMPEIIAAIQDWRDSDNTVSAGGAEIEYYSSLQPPTRPRNGPLQTISELLMVRGVTRDQLLGEDANANGILDPEEDDGNETYPPDNHDGVLDAGWSAYLTVYSSVQNTSASGQDRINIKNAGESELAQVPGIGADLAKAIVAYRGQKPFESIIDLLDVTPVNPQGQRNQVTFNTAGQRGGPPQPSIGDIQTLNQGNATGGPQLISESLLQEIADELTTVSESEIKGVVNVNTAGITVLSCLPGMTRELAQAVISYRQSAGFFPNIAVMLRVPGMTRDILKQLAPVICTRSDTFRILSEGVIATSGARKRIEVIAHMGQGEVTTLAWREDL